MGFGLVYFIPVPCVSVYLTFYLSDENRNEAVSDDWVPASEADRVDKFEQGLAANLLVCCQAVPLIPKAGLSCNSLLHNQERVLSKS